MATLDWQSRVAAISRSGRGTLAARWLASSLRGTDHHQKRAYLVQQLAHLGRFRDARTAFAARQRTTKLTGVDAAAYAVALAQLRLLQFGDFDAVLRLTAWSDTAHASSAVPPRVVATALSLRARAIDRASNADVALGKDISGSTIHSRITATKRRLLHSAIGLYDSIEDHHERDDAVRERALARELPSKALEECLRLAEEAGIEINADAEAMAYLAAADLSAKRDSTGTVTLLHRAMEARARVRSAWRRSLLEGREARIRALLPSFGNADSQRIADSLRSLIDMARSRGSLIHQAEGLRTLASVYRAADRLQAFRHTWLEAYQLGLDMHHDVAVAVLLMDLGVGSGGSLGHEFAASMLDTATTLTLGTSFRHALLTLRALNLSQRGRNSEAIELCRNGLRVARGDARIDLIRAMASPVSHESRHNEACTWFEEGIRLADERGRSTESAEFRRHLAISRLQAQRVGLRRSVSETDLHLSLATLEEAAQLVNVSGTTERKDLAESLAEALFYAGFSGLSEVVFRNAASDTLPDRAGFLLLKLGLLQLDQLQRDVLSAAPNAESLFIEAEGRFAEAGLTTFAIEALVFRAHVLALWAKLTDGERRSALLDRLRLLFADICEVLTGFISYTGPGEAREGVLNAVAAAKVNIVKAGLLIRWPWLLSLTADAVNLMESLRGRAIANQLARRVPARTCSDDPLLLHEQRVAEAMATPQISHSLRAQLVVEQQQLLSQLTSDNAQHERSRVRRAAPTTVHDLLQLAQRHKEAVCVVYWLAPECTWLALINSHTDTVRSVSVRLRDQDVRRAASICSAWRGGPLDPVLEGMAALVAPIEDECPPETPIALVPIGPLHNIPLHALECGGMPLIERHPVVYLPSGTCLHYLEQLSRDWKDDVPRLPSATILGNPGQDDAGRSLTNSGAESTLIANMLGTAPSLGSSVTRASVLNGLTGTDIFHFAGHAKFLPDSPPTQYAWQSYLEVARGQRVTVEDIWQTSRISCRLAVLSACQSGVVSSHVGDETISLSHALLAAGIPRVITTLWPVQDAAAADTITAFYRYLIAGTDVSPAQALRCAMIEMHHHPRWRASVGLWAPFTLNGVWW